MIDVARRAAAEAACPAPAGCRWEWDPAASGDRLRLWQDVCTPKLDVAYCIGAAYGDGRWFVNDKARQWDISDNGTAVSLEEAMRRMLEAARAHGWLPPHDESKAVELVRRAVALLEDIEQHEGLSADDVDWLRDAKAWLASEAS